MLPRNESRLFRWLWRFTLATAGLHVALFTWSIYRRLWQVQRIEVIADSAALAASSSVGYDVITSGEVRNLIRLELVHDERRETLLEQRAEVNRFSGYDPRLFRYRPSIRIEPELLSRFRAGPALLRLTVFGGQKLLRTPAPRVREFSVRLAPPPDHATARRQWRQLSPVLGPLPWPQVRWLRLAGVRRTRVRLDPVGHGARQEALALADALHLERNRFHPALERLHPVAHLGWERHLSPG